MCKNSLILNYHNSKLSKAIYKFSRILPEWEEMLEYFLIWGKQILKLFENLIEL